MEEDFDWIHGVFSTSAAAHHALSVIEDGDNRPCVERRIVDSSFSEWRDREMAERLSE